MWIYFLVVDVFTDVSLVRIVVSQGLYLSRLVLPSIVDDSLKLLHNCVDIIEITVFFVILLST